jgi:hypothetical protein
VASNIIGRFRVFRTGENTGTGKPVFDANPGAAVGGEETEVRGAFRVRKSTADTSEGDEGVFEALPEGAAVGGDLSVGGDTAIESETPSTSPTTGALTVGGGAGIGGALNVGGPLNVGGASSFVRVNGDMIEFYQGGVMKLQMKLGMAAGLLSLLVGLPISCEGLFNQGDNNTEIIDTSVPWTAVDDPKFGTSQIFAIAYGAGKFVAGGESGKAAYSDDGVNWTAVSDTTFGTNGINAIAYGAGKFVAGGVSGKAAYSDDGVNWTAVSDPKFGTSQIFAIAYGAGKFVAGGVSGRMNYSDDGGITWTIISNTTFGTSYIQVITYGAGKLVAGGMLGKTAYSDDGVNWTAVSDTTFGTNGINAIVYGDPAGQKKFVAVGGSGRAVYWDGTITARLVFNANGTVGWVKS